MVKLGKHPGLFTRRGRWQVRAGRFQDAADGALSDKELGFKLLNHVIMPLALSVIQFRKTLAQLGIAQQQ